MRSRAATLGFSTFAARPLINVHDLAVLPEYRGHGIGRALLRAVERAARERGCVKLTLEVQENNQRARSVYAAAGFAQAEYGASGGALFCSKRLDGEAAAAAATAVAVERTRPGR
ncbi:MAG: GNAT family N-acetyltransferase [Deltaproteobacteria bacterium]|nr:GNAT family N-acetyltransferase [Deltaproteobacteria bacterium]